MRLILYYGFVENNKVLLSGKLVHGNLRKPKASDSIAQNIISMFKQYFALGASSRVVSVIFSGNTKKVKTNEYGSFKVYFDFDENSKRTYQARYKDEKRQSKVFLPEQEKKAIISDVDDTFLVSDSSSFFKRIWTSASKNIHTRSSVTDIVDIYKEFSGPVFYVSNSQWRLFEVLDGFRKINNLPQGPFLLKGKSKYSRIKSIMKSYPYKFVLIGDDGQKDPEIYALIQKEYPKKVLAVAIRHVSSKKRFEEVNDLLPKKNCFISSDGRDILKFVSSKLKE